MSFHVGDVTSPDEIVVDCYLRPLFPDNQEFATRWVTLTGIGLSIDSGALRQFLVAVAKLYPMIQGGIGGYRSLAHAAKECSFSGAFSPFEIDPDTRERLGEDQMLRGRFLRRLRRLYPITVIGPEIWSQLPPMPNVDPAPKVEDLGDCKMLTVWPELVEPRDPAFLAGTVELRRWLWPFTIQNPADALEAT
ncbi:MAG: hypothetical protein WKG01_16070 [Kofleriaceae bacterium]